ncbi:aldehyde dehydrogenase family protein (plasmid) [Polymorphobacter sp. PAMC 29334]|nr:aldehyde dehydrogenase family protein [Polymorphobacter sp. PAMC 29334]
MNPATGVLASRSPAMTVREAAAVAAAAASALPAWSALGPNARRAQLNAAAMALEAKGDAIVAAMIAECAAHEGWARFNLRLGADMLREAAALTTQIGGEVIPSDKPGCLAMALREPAGVCLGIAPWNAPVILVVRALAVPLACGNTVILKASEICPMTHGLIVDAFADAGFAPGVVGLVTNAPANAGEVVGALIDHPAVRRINFTGSTAVGRIIAIRAAQNLKPVLLELGGKAPLIVLADADLDQAVKAAAFGSFMNAGQICMSTERIIVVDAVAEAFVAAFTAKVSTMHAASVVDTRAVDHVAALVDAAVAAGARLGTGGPADGVIMPPHVVDHVTPAMALFREESFGPVVAVTRARDEAHAVELANDTDYGLSASVFTRDVARGLTIARAMKSGICHINGPTVHDEAQMPFGGTKASGYGRFGGKAGIDAFTELRWITIETQPGHFPI